MRPDELYNAQKENWTALNALVERGQRQIDSLSPEDVQLLGRLYRQTTSDLAMAQRDFPRHQVTGYLNQLVGRAHAAIYRDEPLQTNRLVDFARHGFPRLFRKTLPFTLVAALLFILPALATGVSTFLAPQSALWLLPVEVQSLIPTIEQRELWVDIPIKERPYASSFIMQNNIRVSFLAFASGMTAGLMTVWVMILNGLILGGLTGLTAHYGVGWELWNFVIGHGVLELSVIFMAGGSGLMLGWAILRPGLMRRRDALTAAAQDAVKLLLGAVPMLVVAGTIEGFISPAENILPVFKWGVGILSGALFYAYLFLAGRETGKMKRLTRPSAPSTPGND
jgi:uncharacterized membrane protein SpoIIM required for sporulation